MDLPLLGKLHIGSATFFDLGVYFAVVGTVLMLIKFLSQGPDEGHKPDF